MRFRVEREPVVAGPGEVVVVPPGAPPDFANDGDRAALVRVEIRPALKMEQLFETAVALAEQGPTMLGGVPKPLELGRPPSFRSHLHSQNGGLRDASPSRRAG